MFNKKQKQFKLGKLPAIEDKRDLKFSTYLNKEKVIRPSEFGHEKISFLNGICMPMTNMVAVFLQEQDMSIVSGVQKVVEMYFSPILIFSNPIQM